MKTKTYLILYYLSFVITIIFMGYAAYKYLELISVGDNNISGVLSQMFEGPSGIKGIIGIINIILVVIVTIFLIKKKKLKVDNIIFPIIYMCFFTIVVVLCFIFNNKVILPYIHFNYYLAFINIGYLFFNVYSLFLIKNNK